MEAIATRLEAIPIGLEGIALRLEAIALRFLSLLGWRSLLKEPFDPRMGPSFFVAIDGSLSTK